MAIYGSYTEIYDMQTMDEQISALKIHTPQDGSPPAHLGGLFAQFRKYKYLGADIVLIPAQQLPLDPLQVSYAEGDSLADPRDVLNPILHKNWSGERTLLDLFIERNFTKKIWGTMGIGGKADTVNSDDVLTRGNTGDNALGQSVTEVDVPFPQTSAELTNPVRFYGALMMDNSWRGAHIQNGLRLKVRPFVHDVQSTRPLGHTVDTFGNYLGGSQYNNSAFRADTQPEVMPSGTSITNTPTNVRSGRIPTRRSGSGATIIDFADDYSFITSGMKPLGWMPTNNGLTGARTGTSNQLLDEMVSEVSRIRLPKVYMHLIVLPPAFKTNFYFRLAVRHKFLFKNLSSLRSIDSIDAQAAYHNRADKVQLPTPLSRLQEIGESTTHDDGANSSIEYYGTDLNPIGGRIDFEEGVDENWEDLEEGTVKAQTLEEQIISILNARESAKTEQPL